MSEIHVSLEFTPNPNTLKYSVNRQLVAQGASNFTHKAKAEERSPLAARLFDIPGICGVMIGKDFVTVTKTEDGDWDVVHKSVSKLIENHLSSNLPVFSDVPQGESASGSQSEVERKIIEILENDIRPALAMDGGDISFERFEDGIVYVYLQGACSGCPGAAMTLKMGIETRLREAIPEVVEVISL